MSTFVSTRFKQTEFRGTFSREFIRFDDSTLVGALSDGMRIKGKAEPGELIPGVPYIFFGVWGDYRGEKQFQFKQFLKAEPHTKYGLVKYLESTAPNVGPVIAGRLFDAFKQDAVRVLRTDPAMASAAVSGLPLDKAEEASHVLKLNAALEETRIDLMDLFVGRGFPSRLANEVINKWGVHAPGRIRRDPFSLLVEGFKGCGFARCDRLYTDLGLPLDSLKRQMICLWNAMQEQNNGHTWHPLWSITSQMKRLVSGNVRPEKAIELGTRSGWLVVRGEEKDRWIAIGHYAKNESQLAWSISRLIESVMNPYGIEEGKSDADANQD